MHSVRFTDTITSLAEQYSYYMARATAGLRQFQDLVKDDRGEKVSEEGPDDSWSITGFHPLGR